MKICIKGLDKVELLKNLWKNQIMAAYYTFSGKQAPDFDNESAKTVINEYIDYFSGKAIKTNLSGDTVEPYLYDRDAGQGKFLQIVNSMRKKN